MNNNFIKEQELENNIKQIELLKEEENKKYNKIIEILNECNNIYNSDNNTELYRIANNELALSQELYKKRQQYIDILTNVIYKYKNTSTQIKNNINGDINV